jgi:asparagine synthase (glutamine-hydrolysing)
MQLEDMDLYDNLIQSTYLQDEPIMHLSETPFMAISKIAKPLVKVLISGEVQMN